MYRPTPRAFVGWGFSFFCGRPGQTANPSSSLWTEPQNLWAPLWKGARYLWIVFPGASEVQTPHPQIRAKKAANSEAFSG